MARNVLLELQRTLKMGCVAMTMKVKEKAKGGKQLVSVGPYHRAVGPKTYAVIGGKGSSQWVKEGSARSMAEVFIDFVGRDHAWEAIRLSKTLKGNRCRLDLKR